MASNDKPREDAQGKIQPRAAEGQKDLIPAPKVALGRGGVEFKSFDELWNWCSGVARSALIPDAYRSKPHDIMVAVQMGMEIGLRPMTALQNMAVVHGKPSLYGEIVMALIRQAGVMDEAVFAEHYEYSSDGQVQAAVSVMGRVGGSPRTERYTVEDAKQAGLWGSGQGWKKYPKDMLLWKARHRNARALFSDVTHGLMPRELAEGDQPATTVEQVDPAEGLDELVRKHAARAAYDTGAVDAEVEES